MPSDKAVPVYPKEVVKLANPVIFLGDRCEFDMAVAINNLEAGLGALAASQNDGNDQYVDTAKWIVAYFAIRTEQQKDRQNIG